MGHRDSRVARQGALQRRGSPGRRGGGGGGGGALQRVLTRRQLVRSASCSKDAPRGTRSGLRARGLRGSDAKMSRHTATDNAGAGPLGGVLRDLGESGAGLRHAAIAPARAATPHAPHMSVCCTEAVLLGGQDADPECKLACVPGGLQRLRVRQRATPNTPMERARSPGCVVRLTVWSLGFPSWRVSFRPAVGRRVYMYV